MSQSQMDLQQLLQMKEELKDSFNKISLTLFNHLGIKYPLSYFSQYKLTINKFFTERGYEPIALYIKYVYSNDSFRTRILAGDDSFFLGESYNTITNEVDVDQMKIFTLKDLWGKMDESNKKITKNSFITITKRTEMYIEVLAQINELKNKK
jgi:hypothetical protein